MQRSSVIVLATCVLVATTLCSSQAVPDLTEDRGGGTGYNMKWDYHAGELIFYRDITAVSAPAVRIIKADGTTIPIYPLADMPGAQAMTIWDIAETTDGGVVFSAIAEYGPRNVRPTPVKCLLLTYSRDGRLTKLWDVYPYHHRHIAVDGQGNVFGIGTKDTPKSSYPLLVKYSADGSVLGEFLPSKMFSVGDRVVDSGSPNGEMAMFVHGDDLFIWSAPTQEILRLSLSGEVLARGSLDAPLKSLATQNGSARAKILELFPGADGKLVAQIQFLPPDGSADPFKFAMATFSSDGSEARLTSSVDVQKTDRFMGGTPEGKLVFLQVPSGGGAVINKR